MKNLTDKVRRIYNRNNVQVNTSLRRIEVYWMKDPGGKIWIPYSGGPLYFDLAMKEAQWLTDHIKEFRSLLPKEIRDWPVILGELDCRSYPGTFIPRVPVTV